jgi:MFS family permease
MTEQTWTPDEFDRIGDAGRVTGRQHGRGVVLAIILTGYLLVLIDVSILMAALPSIRGDLGFSATSLSWAQNAYTLTFGGLLLPAARAGDLLGRRRTFVLGIGLFTAASLAVGLAQSPAGMIAARAVQGIGAATLAPSTLALLSTSFPEGAQRSALGTLLIAVFVTVRGALPGRSCRCASSPTAAAPAPTPPASSSTACW